MPISKTGCALDANLEDGLLLSRPRLTRNGRNVGKFFLEQSLELIQPALQRLDAQHQFGNIVFVHGLPPRLLPSII